LNAVLSVRQAATEDIEAILRVERGAIEAPHWNEAQYRSILQEEAHRILLVAVTESRIVGFVAASVLLEEAELENVAVDAPFRRSGAGKALMESARAWSIDRGAELMRLEVRVGNEAAQRLYRKLGFVQSGVRKAYYSDPVEDAVMMLLPLSKS